jgi:hypothetical protein
VRVREHGETPVDKRAKRSSLLITQKPENLAAYPQSKQQMTHMKIAAPLNLRVSKSRQGSPGIRRVGTVLAISRPPSYHFATWCSCRATGS